ncbi:LytTR family DNA-binding domain-containing protein [Clostridium sp. SHJSY1]|uniref:LytR/AlgR family response regulator transcription factor n=1 Tax=Clostridium sp. SHJSY1 TaxID=2942483 RepID=UPI0028740107|nr:LytTR family DNA-binding domain-containing protein [Clostridium sp. SHJSY1]MDS0527507.1 LytTR family DNA-binding domain-containing protein [Clostridium sp. SHJSY1]
MLKVYIIEDEVSQRERMSSFVRHTIKDLSLDMELALSTDKVKDLICSIEGKGKTGLYFIDIELGQDIHGLELAQIIRKHDRNGFIIFVTTHSELSVLTFQYKIDAMDFIVKDDINIMYDRLRACLIKANSLKEEVDKKSDKIISIDIGKKTVCFDKEKIIFFQLDEKSKKILLHGVNRQVEFNGNIKELENRVGNSFFMINSKALINLKYIKTVNKNKRYVLMDNGEKCKIGFGKMSKIFRLFEN